MTREDIEDVALFRRVSTDRQDVLGQEKALDKHVARGGHNGPAGSYRVVKIIDLPDTSASKERPRHLAARRGDSRRTGRPVPQADRLGCLTTGPAIAQPRRTVPPARLGRRGHG